MSLKFIFIFLPLFLFSYTSKLPQNYESLKAQQKLKLLWNQINETEYKEPLPNQWPNNLEVLSALSPTQLFSRPFKRINDEMPKPIRKLVHTYGVVGVVRLVPSKPPVGTGFLAGGMGLVRLSIGINPSKGMVPGMALKFLVDGTPSVNLQVMNSLVPQQSNNFFERSFENSVKVPIIGKFTLSLRRFLGITSSLTN